MSEVPRPTRRQMRRGEYDVLLDAAKSGEAIWIRNVLRVDAEKVDARYRQAAITRNVRLIVNRRDNETDESMVDLYITVEALPESNDDRHTRYNK
jgi:hypothetical protein